MRVDAEASGKTKWLRAVAIEGAVVTLLLVALGFFYLRPASTELLRGNATVMVGDGTDSVTNPWQYQLVLDTFKSRPQDLLFASVYSDQMNAPEGAAHFILWIEKLLVLLFAPFMSADLMPTAMVWTFMVMAGLSFHAYGRALGWPRAVAFALAVAWAFCPFTRARAVVHIGFDTTYWTPLLFLGLHMLARPPGWLSLRAATIFAAACFLGVFCAGQYFVVMAAIFAPLFLLYYVLVLPRGASRSRAAGRLAIAIAPAVLFGAYNLAFPMPSYAARALSPLVATRSETAFMLKVGGAHPSDYVLGDVKFGTRDLVPWRAKLTAATRAEVDRNRHERTNGIRWSILASCAVLAALLAVRRLRRGLSPTERALGGFAFALGTVAFLFSLSPQGIRIYDVDLGPIQLVNRVFSRFRVPNRIGVLVHFAALLGAGVLLGHLLRARLARPTRGALALSAALTLVMVLDYAPLEAMPLAPIVPPRHDLEGGGRCGSGMTVPFVTWGFFDEEYYEVTAELRRTSCKILHSAYLTREDEIMRLVVGETMFNDGWLEPTENMLRCTGSSWALFRLDTPIERRRAICTHLGWPFIAPDVCRAPAPLNAVDLPPTKSVRQCVSELGLKPANGL